METIARDTVDSTLGDAAAHAVERMRAAGFDQALATASRGDRHEVNIAHNEPSLLRSTALTRLALVGIAGGRRVAAELSAIDDADAVAARIDALRADAESVPVDAAHGVSAGVTARISHGPRTADVDRVADAARDLLAFRAAETPKMVVDECFVAHERVRSRTPRAAAAICRATSAATTRASSAPRATASP